MHKSPPGDQQLRLLRPSETTSKQLRRDSSLGREDQKPIFLDQQIRSNGAIRNHDYANHIRIKFLRLRSRSKSTYE